MFIKYIDAKTKKLSDFVRLVAVGQQSVDQLLDVAKTLCGKPKMINRFAEDFAGILVLADIPVKGNKLTINHSTTGNTLLFRLLASRSVAESTEPDLS